MAARGRWNGANDGNRAARPPAVPTDGLEPVELEYLEDDDGWSDSLLTGFVVAADAERVHLARCEVVRMRFTAARLRRFDVTDVRFVDCDLSQVVFEEFLAMRVTFERCRFSEADLGGARFTDVRFHDCQLDGAALRMVEGERCEVRRGSAHDLDLYRAKLRGSAWLDTDLTGARLDGADLGAARFHGSTLAEIRGATALKGAVIDAGQVPDVGRALLVDLGLTVDADLDG